METIEYTLFVDSRVTILYDNYKICQRRRFAQITTFVRAAFCEVTCNE